MKISEMIKNLEAVIAANGDIECYYSEDDEGNAYHPVYFEPTVYWMNKYGEMFSEKDIEGEDPEDIAELTQVCIVN